MSASSAGRSFVGPAAGVGIAAGLSAVMGSAAGGIDAYGWLAAGWFAAALPGVAGGAWLAGKLGRPDVGILVALGATMAARGLALGIGLIVALRFGEGAPVAFLLGFGATFVPLAVFEAVWFARRSKEPAGR